MTSMSSDSCKLWKLGANLIGEVIMIPFEGEVKEDMYDDEFHCCPSNSGQNVVVMRGSFTLDVYIIDEENEKFEKKDTINIKREILAGGNPGFNFVWRKDIVHDLKFFDLKDNRFKVNFSKDNNFMSAIIELSDNVTQLTTGQYRYSEQGIFAVDAQGDKKIEA